MAPNPLFFLVITACLVQVQAYEQSENCTRLGGHCQSNSPDSAACSGQWKFKLCPGPNSWICCVPADPTACLKEKVSKLNLVARLAETYTTETLYQDNTQLVVQEYVPPREFDLGSSTITVVACQSATSGLWHTTYIDTDETHPNLRIDYDVHPVHMSPRLEESYGGWWPVGYGMFVNQTDGKKFFITPTMCSQKTREDMDSLELIGGLPIPLIPWPVSAGIWIATQVELYIPDNRHPQCHNMVKDPVKVPWNYSNAGVAKFTDLEPVSLTKLDLIDNSLNCRPNENKLSCVIKVERTMTIQKLA